MEGPAGDEEVVVERKDESHVRIIAVPYALRAGLIASKRSVND
ncbi:hypothetical protein FOPG_19764 [Fusarium oxysporum f. sp. conglutinans race 2 54008]|uniref:Uncharacterized protein n=1 Tax=Fusarium oxysporum f. sp. conglutinans race 2 54008 TaxID=1089457 RepID=X0GVX2_FUSOX|nr:hypothetical protein FOPG_19764 [Fusarium oxysporum f. sp. conglutinans race 2 54008]